VLTDKFALCNSMRCSRRNLDRLSLADADTRARCGRYSTHEALREDSKRCALPLYHEAQRLLLCGKHAVNNLLQQEIFSKQDFEAFAKAKLRQQQKDLGRANAQSLSTPFLGNFDQQVLESALLMNGYEMVRSTVGDVGLFGRQDIGKAIQVETSPYGPKHPPIIRLALPLRGTSDAIAHFEAAVEVKWSGECSSLTSTDLEKLLPKHEANEMGIGKELCQDWHVLQRGALQLVVSDFEDPDSTNGSDHNIKALITLSNGWKFTNPLDLWSPLGFIKRVEISRAFGLVRSGHWVAIRKHPRYILEQENIGDRNENLRLPAPAFFNLDSCLPSPRQLPYFCNCGCSKADGDRGNKCECTVFRQVSSVRPQDASNVFVVRKILMSD